MTTDAMVWKWGFRWFWKNGAMIPQNTIAARHQALGYKHWEGHRQTGNRGKCCLKGLPPSSDGSTEKGLMKTMGEPTFTPLTHTMAVKKNALTYTYWFLTLYVTTF